MKKYGFITNGKVTQVIEGKSDASRDWAKYYSKITGLQVEVIPDNVSIGWEYDGTAFSNPFTLPEAEQLEQWRKDASLTRRKFKLGIEFYPWGSGTLKTARGSGDLVGAGTYSIQKEDSPASTSALIYKLQSRMIAGTGLDYSSDGAGSFNESTIILIGVAV